MLKEEFVEKSIKVHGDKYIYDKIPNEFRANDDVIIICPIHGEFTQCARTHYRGGGCPKCGIEKAKVSKLLTTESFLKKPTVQTITKEGIEELAKTVIPIAEYEGFHAHANSVRVRLGKKDD